jgi:serine/threonine protein kinase
VTARNILIFNKDLAKLSDIGVASDFDANNKSTYANGSPPLPIKWHAPEAVLFKRFSEKSDVWSFGVTLWEAFASGATPFHEISNSRFMNYMKNIDDDSTKLCKPAECPEYVYELINKCIVVNETNRPSFADICTELDNIIKQLQIRNFFLNS